MPRWIVELLTIGHDPDRPRRQEEIAATERRAQHVDRRADRVIREYERMDRSIGRQ